MSLDLGLIDQPSRRVCLHSIPAAADFDSKPKHQLASDILRLRNIILALTWPPERQVGDYLGKYQTCPLLAAAVERITTMWTDGLTVPPSHNSRVEPYCLSPLLASVGRLSSMLNTILPAEPDPLNTITFQLTMTLSRIAYW